MTRMDSIAAFRNRIAELGSRSPVVAVARRTATSFVAVAVPMEAEDWSFWLEFEAANMPAAIEQLGTKVLVAVDPNMGTGTLPPPYPPPKLIEDPEALAEAVRMAILALYERTSSSQ